MSDIVTKCCTVCKQDKPLTDYYAKTGKCKSCTSKIAKEKYIPKHPPVPEGHKRCPRCEQIFPATLEYFHSHKKSGNPNHNGLNSYCKPCQSEYEEARHTKPKDTPPKEFTCSRCGETKPTTDEFFHRNRRAKNGFVPICKNCKNIEQNIYYHSNEETKARRQAGGRAYQKAHRAEKRSYWKQWYRANREQQRAYKNAYRKQDHVRVYRRVENLNRRASLLNAPGTHTKQDIQDQFKRQKGCCYWCRAKLPQGKRAYHVDHIVPLTREGSNWPDNLVIACHTCNESRNNKLPHEWPEGGRLL